MKSHFTPPDIRTLPSSVVNKIAAGEVIERPASVVKELLENAVDAGATHIDVSVEQGGSELIRVSDDGCGIRADQLPLAVASHATSKISVADDLFQVRSLGFRGEALASMAEVSQLLIRSRAADAQAGAELEVIGGRMGEVRPCGCPVGTTLEVRQLFFNTPVRRKFLRTTQTEIGHTIESFTRIALACHDRHVTLRHNDRVVYDLPAVDRWLDRIAAFFGHELGDSLIWIESRHDDIHLTGYVAEPSVNRGSNRLQYLLLNGRHIRDRSLQHALSEAYRGLLLTGRFPVAFLRLEMPPELVDVNVHPAKLEVRFADGRQLYSQLLGTLRNKFLMTDLTTRAPLQPAGDEGIDHGHDRREAERHRENTMRWARGGTAPSAQEAASSSRQLPWGSPATAIPEFRPFGPGVARTDAARTDAARTGTSAAPDHGDQVSLPERADPPHSWPPRQVREGLQVHNRYLVTETEDGLVVIDQHALHERILYEQLRTRVLSGTLESQRLLVPEPVALTPTEASAALESRDVLARLGMDVEPFGGGTILVSSYPAMLANFNPVEILRQVVEQLLGSEKSLDRRDLLDELLHMISCKAAIKAGDRLSREEIQTLLEQRHYYQDAHHCPHGRPTALVFTNVELDKRFKRI
jgi:DNA mismatch repair protein MutL